MSENEISVGQAAVLQRKVYDAERRLGRDILAHDETKKKVEGFHKRHKIRHRTCLFCVTEPGGVTLTAQDKEKKA